MSLLLRDGSRVEDHRLDRLIQFDPRNLDYPIRALITPEQQTKPRSFTWSLPTFLDQGHEGACVGFSITHELLAKPVPIHDLDATFAREQIYWAAQRADDWPGGSYPGATPAYEGTSVLAGAKVATAAGYYTEYRWASSVEDLALAIGYKGPAVLGINWHDGMMDTDSNGYIHVTGPVVGGHAILVNSYHKSTGRFMLSNSWGIDWGLHGHAYVSTEDMTLLLGDNGEAMIPVHRRRPVA